MQKEAIRPFTTVANFWLFVRALVCFKMLSVKQGSSMYHFKVFGVTLPGFELPTSLTQSGRFQLLRHRVWDE